MKKQDQEDLPDIENVCFIIDVFHVFQSLRALLGVIIEEDTDIGVGLDDVDQTLGVHLLDLVAHREVVVVGEELKNCLLVLQVALVDKHISVPVGWTL